MKLLYQLFSNLTAEKQVRQAYPENSMNPSRQLRNNLWTVLCCIVLALGIRNVALACLRHSDHPGWDFTLRYSEASCLVQLHEDPRDIFTGVVQDDLFVPYRFQYERSDSVLDYRWCCGYPPWEYTIMIPFSFLSLNTADILFKIMEVLAIFGLVAFSLRRSGQLGVTDWKRLLLAYSIFLLPPEAWFFAFRYGNWTIPFCLGVVCLVLSLQRHSQVLAGFCWAFLMIKPQQGIWFAIPILFRRQFKCVAVAVATCLAASIPPAVLCGKSPITLILEIPGFRVLEYYETTLFPPVAYRFMNNHVFPKTALFASIVLCLIVCLIATWKLRKESDWFTYLQPTFFGLCAGYPLWHQDWLFFFFPMFFLLEIWAMPNGARMWVRICSLILAFLLGNPLSWVRYNSHFGFGVGFSPEESLSFSSWLLLVFLICFVLKNRPEPKKLVDVS